MFVTECLPLMFFQICLVLSFREKYVKKYNHITNSTNVVRDISGSDKSTKTTHLSAKQIDLLESMKTNSLIGQQFQQPIELSEDKLRINSFMIPHQLAGTIVQDRQSDADHVLAED